jgi:hypothetical protein
MTGANQRPGALNLDYTKPAGPKRRQIFQITQGRNLNSIPPRYFENSHPFTPTKANAIHCQRYVSHDDRGYLIPAGSSIAEVW